VHVSEIVEAVTPQQLEQMRSLSREYLSQLPLELSAGRFEAEVLELPGDYAPPRGKLLLATVAGQPAGCVALRPFPLDGVCEMKRLYVRPPFRTGSLGRALIDRIVQTARELGYRRMRLDTHPPTMMAAVNLYRRMGFYEVAPDPLTPMDGLLYLELSLSVIPKE
jgi:GNAT superfamily N-acetyltransferase